MCPALPLFLSFNIFLLPFFPISLGGMDGSEEALSDKSFCGCSAVVYRTRSLLMQRLSVQCGINLHISFSFVRRFHFPHDWLVLQLLAGGQVCYAYV